MTADRLEPADRSEAPELSLVIPLYRSSGSIDALIQRLEDLALPCAWELVMVDDGSPDDTVERARRRLRGSPLRVLLIRHARNYGEHQAVLTGYRHCRGRWVINLDDDLQNPPEEALRLWRKAAEEELDVVYGNHLEKRHAPWRNLGSRFANRTANWLLDLPDRLYLSSFRCVAGPIARQVAQYSGPYPYIDGLLSQYTQRIGTLTVHHDPRLDGESNYNMRRLVRLWLTIFTSFSIMPLRLASLLGVALAVTGLLSILILLAQALVHGLEVAGWLSIISAILIFGGLQCLLIGVLGEYLGRIFLTVSGKPQSFARSIEAVGTWPVEPPANAVSDPARRA
jgi:undecaprenyl-phosphate 4-deoxy-4-formamido-L-arabinose transferase